MHLLSELLKQECLLDIFDNNKNISNTLVWNTYIEKIKILNVCGHRWMYCQSSQKRNFQKWLKLMMSTLKF